MQEGQKIAEMRAKGMQELVLDKLVEVLEAETKDCRRTVAELLQSIEETHDKNVAERAKLVEHYEKELKLARDNVLYYKSEVSRVASNLHTRAVNDAAFRELVVNAEDLAEHCRTDRRKSRHGLMIELAHKVTEAAIVANKCLEEQASR